MNCMEVRALTVQLRDVISFLRTPYPSPPCQDRSAVGHKTLSPRLQSCRQVGVRGLPPLAKFMAGFRPLLMYGTCAGETTLRRRKVRICPFLLATALSATGQRLLWLGGVPASAHMLPFSASFISRNNAFRLCPCLFFYDVAFSISSALRRMMAGAGQRIGSRFTSIVFSFESTVHGHQRPFGHFV